MPIELLWKLLGIFAIVAAGWLAGRAGWVGAGAPGGSEAPQRSAAQVLGQVAFTLFMPALLFRTTARIDFAGLPWRVLAVFFVPLGLALLALYLHQRRAQRAGGADEDVARAPVRAITMGFGNTVQLGIPLAAALFGEAGLAVHLAIVSLHALLILTLLTALAEADLARAQARRSGGRHALWPQILATARRTVVHPVVLPVLAGIGWNLAGLPLPAPVDELLALLAQAAVPLCLVIIGLSFAEQGLHGLRQALRPAVTLSLLKLVALPALVLLTGTALDVGAPALAVIVMCAALPTGSNALIFAQRYRTLTGEVTVTTVLSTLAFAVTAPLWLLLLGAIGAL